MVVSGKGASRHLCVSLPVIVGGLRAHRDIVSSFPQELRTYASSVIEEARRPGFVTADPGFDSVVRTSRRPPEMAPAVVPPRNIRKQNRKSRGSASALRRGRGAGPGPGGPIRGKGRDSDSASVADDTGDEETKVRQSGGNRGSGAGASSVEGEKAKIRSGLNKKRKPGGKGKSQALSDEDGSARVGGSSSDSSVEEDIASQDACSASEGSAEKSFKKRGGRGGKKRVRQPSDCSSQEETR